MRTRGHATSTGTSASRQFDANSGTRLADHPCAKAPTLWRSAVRGSAAAQYMLGMVHMMGNGVPQDFAEGAKWLRRAADRGHTGGQYNLGIAYARGKGVPRNVVQACMWFYLAAMAGSERANRFRDSLLKSMTTDQIAVAQRMALDWKQIVRA